MVPLIATALASLLLILGTPERVYTQTSAESLLDNRVEALQVQDTPIEDVLRLLAEQNNMNLIIGPDSMGTVTLRFSEVSLRSALDAILRAKGYQYLVHNDIILVSQPDSLERIRGMGLETRMFKLKWADARNVKATLDTAQVLSPWGKMTVYFRSVNVEAAKAASIKPGLAFISGEQYNLVDQTGGTQVPLQTRSDIILVTDQPAKLDEVAVLIEMLDQPVRQIAIDVHFVETILDKENKVGIDWQKLLQVEGAYKGKTNWKLGDERFQNAGESGGVLQLGALSQTRFDVILDMMLQTDRSKLLSQPSITTINHQPATISVGVTYWIEERTGSAGSGDLQISYRERQIPIELIVVPHIQHDDLILLELRPRVEEITGFQQTASGSFALPLITSRSADARVVVKNGEIAVIGGLIKEQQIIVEKDVFLLSSLPFIGHLFRHKYESDERTDLTIFIAPRIVGTEVKGESDQAGRGSHAKLLDKSIEKPIGSEPKIAPAPVKQVEDIRLSAKSTKSIPKKPEKTEPEGDPIDMKMYFPLETGLRWGYMWRQADGTRWESDMTISAVGDQAVVMSESARSGPNPYKGQTGYRWAADGMINLYRVIEGKDSVAYDPPRTILPAGMIEGKVYENNYEWSGWDSNRDKTATKRVVQRQRLIGSFTVNTPTGRFPDCLAVETIWFDPKDPENTRTRKVVWYAPNVGPVKVESGISANSPTLRGKISALLKKR